MNIRITHLYCHFVSKWKNLSHYESYYIGLRSLRDDLLIGKLLALMQSAEEAQSLPLYHRPK